MHSCPTCGQACYCKGDIDDIECDPSAADRCSHCDEREEEADDDGELHCGDCGRVLDANGACAPCDRFYGDD